jgi:hypothetical protein
MKLWLAAIQLLLFFLGPKLHASTLAIRRHCGVLAHSIAAGLFGRGMPRLLPIHFPYQKLVRLWIITLIQKFGDISKVTCVWSMLGAAG